MSERPVGVFDSGLGGASVLREALRLLPNENYIYYGDSGNAPYGDKSDDDITALTMACIDKLMAMNVKAILHRLQHRNRGFRIQGTAAHESILHAHHKHRTCHKACLRSSRNRQGIHDGHSGHHPSQQVSRTSGAHAGSEPGDQHTMPRHS